MSDIRERILLLRGRRVMIGRDLAELYGVEPRAIVQALKRNRDRFPPDFVFKLTDEEAANLKSQSVISSWGGARGRPFAFTQEGVAMLSGVLRSPLAVKVNIEIMRAFVRMRQEATAKREVLRKVIEHDRRLAGHDTEIDRLFRMLQEMMEAPEEETKKIGFSP